MVVATPDEEVSASNTSGKSRVETLSGIYRTSAQDIATGFSLHLPWRSLLLTSATLEAVAGVTWVTANGTRVLCRSVDMFDPSTCDKTVETLLEEECPNTTTVTDPDILSALKR